MINNQVYQSELELPDYHQNLARMLNDNAARFLDHTIYQEVRVSNYSSLTWRQFQKDVISIQNNLANKGLVPGDRVAILY